MITCPKGHFVALSEVRQAVICQSCSTVWLWDPNRPGSYRNPAWAYVPLLGSPVDTPAVRAALGVPPDPYTQPGNLAHAAVAAALMTRTPVPRPACECGAHAIGAPRGSPLHSSWCGERGAP